MVYSITLSPAHGYLLLVNIGYYFLTIYHGLVVFGLRKKLKFFAPNTFFSPEEVAKDALKRQYNCAQRAHFVCKMYISDIF